MANIAQAKHIFRPRARLILLLGDQLIRDQGIAVFELVKNAYDADANRCRIQLENVSGRGPQEPRVIVEDDGSGMGLDTVLNAWLEPGTSYRKDQREEGRRTKMHRRLPLGEKGVGRFAAHKLGRVIQVVTRRARNPEVVVRVDWGEFERAKYLQDVPIEVFERDPEVFTGSRSGTRIEITQLRNHPWTRRQVRSLHRSITSISPPFGGTEGFATELIVEPEADWLEGLLRQDEILPHALFHFKATLSGSTLDYEYCFLPAAEMERVNERQNRVSGFPIIAEEPIEEDPEPGVRPTQWSDGQLPPNLPAGSRKKGYGLVNLDQFKVGEVKVQLFIFDLERLVLRMLVSDPKGLKSYLDQNGGVRVYRDAVRVYDFGEPGNDWLDLEGRRVNVPAKRIGNNQVIGAVFLRLDESTGLVEKTNREGFVENDAYRALREAVRCAIAQAAAERNQDKERIRRAYSGSKAQEPVLDDLEELRRELAKRKLDEELGPILDRVGIQYRHVTEQLLVAAGAGLNLAAVLHQIGKDIKYLRLALDRGEDRDVLKQIADRLGRMTDAMAWLMRDSPRETQRASDFINHAVETWRFRFEHHHIQVTNGFDLEEPDPDFKIRASRRLVLTALMNLIDNAIYWLGTRDLDRRLYLGTTYELHGKPALVVADNGPGIIDPPELVIQPFFTRKPHGTGLGLHIASEIMKQHGGRLCFVEPGDVTLPHGFSGAIVLLEFGRTQ